MTNERLRMVVRSPSYVGRHRGLHMGVNRSTRRTDEEPLALYIA
jgi:hypothetical protein